MRSFTNKDGNLIEVSQEHLDTAVKIKMELQKASPARRCGWRTLVRLMEEEGFPEAENSENYRQMVKLHQKDLGNLPDAKTHAELVTDGKLASVKQLVGEIAYEKRESQHVLKELNKVKRELIDYSLIAEQVAASFQGYDWTQHQLDVKPRKGGDKKMIACLSDMHIGALVDTELNRFNFEVALRRLETYAAELIASALLNGVSDIHVVNLGDVVEHSNMRYGQAYSSEFLFSDQIPRAADAIIKFLLLLAKEGFKLTYSGIAGNHDRVTDKDRNIHGDHAVKPINRTIQIFVDNADCGDITYVPATDDYHHRLLDVNGVNFKFVHGDLDSLKDEQLVSKHSALDNIEYSVIVGGHVHHYRDIEVGYKKRILVFGSLKGADEYGEKIRKISAASQGYILVHADGTFEANRIELP